MKAGMSAVERRLLDAAMACFAADGYHGSTTKAICNRAECTEGSLYRLFGSKDKLFEASLLKSFQHSRRLHPHRFGDYIFNFLLDNPQPRARST
jgi:AcrR family transcriptional regulator